MKLSVFWFRRDLRLEDNTALNAALESGFPVLPIFIFDTNILNELPADDARVSFIYDKLGNIHEALQKKGSSLLCLHGDPLTLWHELLALYDIAEVYINKDYESYACKRDEVLRGLLLGKGIQLNAYKDQVLFEENEVVKANGEPYLVFTPYKKKWLETFRQKYIIPNPAHIPDNYYPAKHVFPSRAALGFRKSDIEVNDYNLRVIDSYADQRDFPTQNTSFLGPHLRFGTLSIRWLMAQIKPEHEVFLSELIWREFFMQILFHFPHVVSRNFQARYNSVPWRNNEEEFEKWCAGKTGYPMVDAGMRQLNATGFMHNRVRMVTAGFLCKHLLIDWRWGEAYFAKKLLDYELASNNGNWQWAAGTGVDAAPYFRIFNPAEQIKKFDKEQQYVRQWIPEFGTAKYPTPLVEHKFARERAIRVYKDALAGGLREQ